MKIEQNDFLRFALFIEDNYGINLREKKHIVQNRLAPLLKEKNIDKFSNYIDYIIKLPDKDIDNMIDKITTNHTYFMREQQHYQYLLDTILGNIIDRKQNNILSIWSAGCSSGQEAYNISIVLKEFFGNEFSSWDTRVLATDISGEILQKAIKAEYTEGEIDKLPKEWLTKYFYEKNNIYTPVSEIRNNVIFRKFNLMDTINFRLKFDIIFCRNVMIYFVKDVKDELIERFYQATNDYGYLLIGHSETVTRELTKYKYISPATYLKSE